MLDTVQNKPGSKLSLAPFLDKEIEYSVQDLPESKQVADRDGTEIHIAQTWKSQFFPRASF
jgi:hypothetical protein